MSKYTLELREMVETFGREEARSWFSDYDFKNYLTDEQLKTVEDTALFSKDYLADMIIDHFYLREIGFETPGMFIHYARNTMRELMSRYALVIYSCSVKFDPINNIDFTESYQESTASQGNSSTSSSGLGISSDTPQGQISKDEILQGKYATATSATEDEGESNATTSGTKNYTIHKQGNQGIMDSNQYLLKEFRRFIEPFYANIIKELNVLFIAIY